METLIGYQEGGILVKVDGENVILLSFFSVKTGELEFKPEENMTLCTFARIVECFFYDKTSAFFGTRKIKTSFKGIPMEIKKETGTASQVILTWTNLSRTFEEK